MMTKKLPLKWQQTLKMPVINAPMFLVSGTEMVIESCKNGIIGTIPLLNARTQETMEEWLSTIKDTLKAEERSGENPAPWGVNLIAHRTNARYEEGVELIKKYQPPLVITSLGSPAAVVEIVHGYGGLVFADVINLTFAKKAAATGVDGLILVANGAGGHGGVINPFSFTSSVKQFFEGIVILAGGISTGKEIFAAQVLGADLVQMGTRFIAAKESAAQDEYKEMIINSNFEDLIYTDVFSGVNANYLIPSIKNAGVDMEELKASSGGGFTAATKMNEKKAWKDIWSAGQGVTVIDSVETVEAIVRQLKEDYRSSVPSQESLYSNS